MAAQKTPGTVKTLQARPKVAAKTSTTKSTGGAKAKKVTAQEAKVEPAVVEKTASKKTSLDVLRLFVKTYANL